MPVSKPTKYPDFAMTDVTDPASGQPNVIEPAAGKKSDGWVYNEKPPRQYFNWMQRLNSLWIRWVDDYITNTLSGILSGINSILSSHTTSINTLNTEVGKLTNWDTDHTVRVTNTITSTTNVVDLSSYSIFANNYILISLSVASLQTGGIQYPIFYKDATHFVDAWVVASGIQVNLGTDTLSTLQGNGTPIYVYATLQKIA